MSSTPTTPTATGKGSINPSQSSAASSQDVTLHIARAALKQQRQQQRIHKTRTIVLWVKEQPWLSGFLLLLALVLITAVIVLPVCATHYCSGIPLYSPPDDPVTEPIQGPSRLIVQFRDVGQDALSMLPAVLRPYANRTLLGSSNLQILQFIDEDILATARDYLASHNELNLLVRDFAMRRFPLNFSNFSSLPNITNTLPYLGNPPNNTGLENLLGSIFGRPVNSTSAGRRLMQQSNDPLLAQPYVANDPLMLNGSQWFQSRVQADRSWLLSKGSASVVVAIIDTGMDLTHPDLKDNLWVNKREIPGNGIDDDGNGYIDDVNGWDFEGNCQSRGYDGSCICGPRSTPWDNDGHGTHIAGIIAGLQDNWIGGTGVAPGVKLMILRVADCLDGSIYASAVAAAYDYALRMGAQVVQCSFGMSYPNYFYPTNPAPWYSQGQNQVYISAIKPLEQKGMLVVAAAGNEYLDMDNLYSLGYSYNPCLVQLSNVLCVAATDAQDKLASFSNRGTNTVHIAAPGTAIISTMKNNSYASLTGTSMAAPVISGIAALSLSILGATTGNYYQAQKVRELIVTKGDPIAGLEVQSGRRANAFTSSLAALQIASASNSSALTLVRPDLASSSKLPLLTMGLTETYVALIQSLWGNQLSGLPAAAVVDASIRPAVLPSISNFKLGVGYAVALTSYLNLTSGGLYSIQVQTSQNAALPALVFVNGQRISLSSAGIGAFQVIGPGYYAFEMQLPLPMILLQQWVFIKSPQGSFLDSSQLFFTVSGQALPVGGMPSWSRPAVSSSSFQPASLELNNGWQVSYNVTPTATTLPDTLSKAALIAANPSATLSYAALLPDLNHTASMLLSTALLQGSAAAMATGYGGAGATAVFGRASARLRTLGSANSFMLSTTCNRCIVWLDGLMVIDNWEGAIQGNPAIVLVKNSSCISLPSGSNAPILTVTFSASSLFFAQLGLRWLPCSGGGTPSSSLAPNVTSSSLWQPALDRAGRIDGVQCDVWRSGNLPAMPAYQSTPRGAQVAGSPTFKVRLDQGAWNQRLQDLLPGIEARFPASASPAQLFAVRCWTYVPTGTPSLSILLPGTAGSSATATLQIGDQQAGPVSAGASVAAQTPLPTMPGVWRMLVVAQWQNVTVDVPLTVLSAGQAMPISFNSTMLPLLVRGAAGTLTPRSLVPGVGPPGHYSITAMADRSLDVPQLSQYEQSSLQLLGSFSSPSYGLDGTFLYNSALTSQLRYTQADGYLTAVAPGTQTYLIRLLDDVATATSLVMAPGVSVINARPFSAQNGLSVVEAAVVLPAGYVYTEALAKTARPDGQTSFYSDLSLPYDPQANADGPIDGTIWYRPVCCASS